MICVLPVRCEEEKLEEGEGKAAFILGAGGFGTSPSLQRCKQRREKVEATEVQQCLTITNHIVVSSKSEGLCIFWKELSGKRGRRLRNQVVMALAIVKFLSGRVL